MPQPCTLVMDSSSSPLLLALEKQGRTYAARRKGIKQEKLLFPLLRTLLAKSQADLKDLSRIFIIRGPGRFTGIRIALTFASMMQSLNHTSLSAATLFEVLFAQTTSTRAYKTWQKTHPRGAVAVVLHAFREEYFLQIFDGQNSAPRWLSRAELLDGLAAYKNPLWVVGTDRDFTPLHTLLGPSYTVAPYKDCRVMPRTLMRMAQDPRWAVRTVEPLYLKPARFELVTPQ